MSRPGAGRWSSFARVLLAVLCSTRLLCGVCFATNVVEQLESGFAHPPHSAAPWVNWFWLDGNVSREGITADLEAMRQVGIGGVLLMDVAQNIPRGSADFGSPEWLRLVQHTVAEANRLGLELTINNDPGWTGSGGPWVKPEESMQKLVWSKTNATGPAIYEGPLPRLPAYHGLCWPVATLAFPQLVDDDLRLSPHRNPAYSAQSGLARGGQRAGVATNMLANAVISPTNVLDLSKYVDADGRLRWDVPPGKWTILRFGHMPTGRRNPAARAEGSGLECDKLDGDAVRRHFDAYIGKLVKILGTNGLRFTATHGDSWECGFQNWTPRFREEFRSRRGYDLLPYLPAFTARFVGDAQITDRFLWDVRRTIADLFAEKYAGGLADMAHQHCLRLSLEAYGNGPFDDLQYASKADMPMSEFWNGENREENFQTSRSMSSAAHVYGRTVVAAEAFTAWPANGKWEQDLSSLKSLGDWALSEGVNRLMFHRFAHQPWLNRFPGMTMGMWGIHYDRTETWWEFTRAWHQYLARCQFLLQQGQHVADVCYLTDEGAYTEPPAQRDLQPPLPAGYNYDLAHPEALLSLFAVRDGQFILPGGASYRVLVLPPNSTMTPSLVAAVSRLVEAGGTVVGPRPDRSPSLSDFPQADVAVRRAAAELWGDCDGTKVTRHAFGKGRVFWGQNLESVFAESKLPPDLAQKPNGQTPLRWIHRRAGEAELYFLSNPSTNRTTVDCTFRVTGKRPEIWDPLTGMMVSPASWMTNSSGTSLTVDLGPMDSCFVVFRTTTVGADPVVRLTRDGMPISANALTLSAGGTLVLRAESNGQYEIRTRAGQVSRASIRDLPERMNIEGQWQLSFSPLAEQRAPEVTLERLISWSDHPNANIRYFSGTGVYKTRFQLTTNYLANGRRVELDLGDVAVVASVTLNGKELGDLWRAPFKVDVTEAVKPGENQLEIKVANLWPNRLIGDEQLGEDCDWVQPEADNSGLKQWPQWLLDGKPSPSGRKCFKTWKFFSKNSPLLKSGLLGPVQLRVLQCVACE